MTIEERAKDRAVKCAGWNDTIRVGFATGYVIGATEMLDKACEWLYNDLANLSESVRRGIVRDFKKAMEEYSQGVADKAQ